VVPQSLKPEAERCRSFSTVEWNDNILLVNLVRYQLVNGEGIVSKLEELGRQWICCFHFEASYTLLLLKGKY